MAQETEEGRVKGVMPPYYAYSTFKTFLRHMKPHKLPNRVDRSLLRSFAGGDQGRILTSLRFLRLIDDTGKPTERFRELIGAYETDQWPGAVDRLLRANYAPLFQVDLATATPAEFDERFRKAFPGAEDVVRKSKTFFLNAAHEATIEISSHITANKKPRAAGTSPRKRPAKSATPPAQPPNGRAADTSQPKPPNAYELLAVLDLSDMNQAEQAAVWTLIQYLKRKEAGVSTRRTTSARARSTADAAMPPEAPSG